MTSYVLDDAWPEFRRFVAEQIRPTDQILSPGFLGRDLAGRYAWGGMHCANLHSASLATLNRHVTMRRVAGARGAVRQAAYLKADDAIARALARRIDYRSGHLVVQQALLPWLWRLGTLGGRTFDVLMTRYPFAELHRRLDACQAIHSDSSTIGDFRAPADLVAVEGEALAAARRLVSPHHDIAGLFGDRGLWLDWARPAKRARSSADVPRTRIAFLGPVITRQGAHEARAVAAQLAEPLVVFGSELEGAGFWEGVAVERRSGAPADLDDVAVILHPAVVTNAPRKLLQAVADGIVVYAWPSCGLAPQDFRPFDSFVA